MIKLEFKSLFQLHVGSDPKLDKVSDIIFEALINITVKIYHESIKKGSIYAHEKLDQIRHQFILNSLENLQENIELLLSKNAATIQDYLDFEEKYRKDIEERFGSFRSPHLENAERIPLDDLYVTPNFSSSLEYKGEKRDVIAYENLVSNIYRSVILGDPGAGKTTFAHKVCYDFSRGFGKSKFSGRDLTPILVVLRDYGIKQESDGLSIIQYIEHISNSWYQEPSPKGAFEYLLKNGRALIIFDGLDELIDTNKRQLISDNIESFSHHFPSVPILITSRKVGYEQAPLSKDRFGTFYIADFDDSQVEEYVNKWFNKNYEDVSERKSKIQSFLTDSIIVKDLRSNPLILSLMCDIYRGEGYIPKNRPEVYEKCSELLLKKWDKVRGVSQGLPLESHLKPTLGYIAFKLYSDDRLLGGVTDRKLKEIAVEFLYPRHYDSEDDAISQAERFIDFSRGRAWVFSEIGAPGQGERLYQFTHRTFLEYFTAYYLVRNYQTSEELLDFLLPKIIKREWDVIAQLALQMKRLSTQDAENQILTRILEETNGKDIKLRFNLISFSVRSLEFIVPSPFVIKNIVGECLDLCVDLSRHSIKDTSLIRENYTLDELINPLLVADKENIQSIRKSLINNISSKIKSSDDEKASSMLKIFSSLPSFDLFFRFKGKEHLLTKIDISRLQKEIIQGNKEIIFSLCKNHEYNAIDGIIIQNFTIEDAVHYHGSGILFSVNAVYGTYPILVSSIIDDIFNSCAERIRIDSVNYSTVVEEISRLSNRLMANPLPWEYSTSSVSYPLISPFFVDFIIQLQNAELDSKNLFSLFTLIAPLIENDLKFETSSYLHVNIFNKIQSIECTTLDPILFIFRGRLYGYIESEVDDLINIVGFSGEHKDIISKWIKRELNFLELTGEIDDEAFLQNLEIYPY